ncbi:MAG: hypothetical protein AB7U82_03370 [Blastocatellales bacterium]
MKKLSLLIALTLLGSSLLLSPLTAIAQDEKQAEFERAWYAACYTEKNDVKCYQLSKELLAKYANSTYAKNATAIVKNKDLNNAWQKFQAALDAFYKQSPQDAAKLEALFAAGNAFHQVEPDQQNPFHLFVLGQMAIAGNQAAAVTQFYKNLDAVNGYSERAMKAFESAQASDKTKKDFDLYVAPLKDLVIANGNQFFGFRLIETKGDQQQALDYLTKAVQVRSKDGAGWKDPYNYFLRSTVYFSQYAEMRKPYDAMTDEQKLSDAGKETLKKVNDLLDTKLIPEYARVLATATRPEVKPLYDAVKPQFDPLWDYRTGDKDKAPDYIRNYVADPTVASVPIPAKAEDASNLDAPAAPTTGAANVKLQAGGAAIAPGAKQPSTNGNGAKPTSVKGQAVKSRRKRG